MQLHLEVKNLCKVFDMHILDGKKIVAFENINFSLERGKFLGISGKSGYGKSSLIRCIYRNYNSTSGDILFYDEDGGCVNLATAPDIEIINVRTHRMGYVSQFFQTIPRVTTMNVVIEPLIDKGWKKDDAIERARELFQLFDIPKNLWDAFPSTFSGGEKQRINLMRTLIDSPELLLLDEPTASLDRKNRGIILGIIKELKKQNITIIGIFHNPEELEMMSDEILALDQRGRQGEQERVEYSIEENGFAFQV